MAANGFGDRLARGSKSAAFPSMSSVPQKKWDSIFGPREDAKPKRKKKSKPSSK